MGKQFIFGNIEVEKKKIYSHKNPILKLNTDRIIACNKLPFGKKGLKYFIGYEDDHEKAMPLCIILSKMSAYRRDFDKTKYMLILIKDKELPEKYDEKYKVSKVIKKKI